MHTADLNKLEMGKIRPVMPFGRQDIGTPPVESAA
jgi:hypothetical protein